MKKYLFLILVVITFSCKDNVNNNEPVLKDKIEFGSYYFDECKQDSFFVVIDTFGVNTGIAARVIVTLNLTTDKDMLYLNVADSKGDTVHRDSLNGLTKRVIREHFYFSRFQLQQVGEYIVSAYYVKGDYLGMIPSKKIYVHY